MGIATTLRHATHIALGLLLGVMALPASSQSAVAIDVDALRRAIDDLGASFQAYPAGDYINRLDRILQQEGAEAELAALQREALLANPLLDFEHILLVRRGEDAPKLGLPQNWQGNCVLPREGYDDTLVRLSLRDLDAPLEVVFRPEPPRMIADVDLHFGGQRMLFSMLGSHNRWQIWEMGVDGRGLRQVTPGLYPDIDDYDACYLPDGRIIFASTRPMQGVPCVTGSCVVANLCIMDADGGNVRQLTFDQDHNWTPAVMNNGRVLYTRWEYSDTAHYFSRLLFTMNPDGTNQAAFYGSNSYWPNSIFYARPIPGHPTQVVGIVSGHHGVARMGELILFDAAKGRFEADGVVQRIPGWGEEVEPVIVDELVNNSWPKFLHPHPLSDKYFLASAKPTKDHSWGLYLVDVFDNMLLLREDPGSVLFEPTPLQARPTPPIVPDRVDLTRKDAIVYLADVYSGPGLDGVPRGTVKDLRLYEFHYGYPEMGGHANVGIESAWDVHRILGTVPVQSDGSALFQVPANTPIAVQPLDENGAAVQVMRSWFTAMPGEMLSCVGCHEQQNTTPPSSFTLAAQRAPERIQPWRGPARGFSFKHEVQPVLDQYCVGCHDGRSTEAGKTLLDLRRQPEEEIVAKYPFTPSYLRLHPYVRRPGPESDYHLPVPYEWHVSTSELVQMLEKGHHGVRLDEEAWDRLITWIDLNVPDHGTWTAHQPIASDYHERRLELRRRYAGIEEDPEVLSAPPEPVPFVMPQPPQVQLAVDGMVPPANWPFEVRLAKEMQAEGAPRVRRKIDLGDGVSIRLVRVPAGSFVMGSADGAPDEVPLTPVTVSEPFWMAITEVTNAQYHRFDPTHDNGYHNQQHKDHTTPGYSAHGPEQPVMRVSWEAASAFCAWLGERLGEPVALPTEAQWEWACRAGSDGPAFYGDLDADFSAYANLADSSISLLAVSGVNPQPIKNPNQYQDFLPKDARFDDGEKLMADVGRYAPNPWGLHDMHGNVWEWTRSLYRPYPYSETDGRNNAKATGARVVRGGSWHDRPARATASYRLAYPQHQRVFNVGFRIVIPAGERIAQN